MWLWTSWTCTQLCGMLSTLRRSLPFYGTVNLWVWHGEIRGKPVVRWENRDFPRPNRDEC